MAILAQSPQFPAGMDGAGKAALQLGRRRLVWGAGLFLLVFFVLALRTVELGVARGVVETRYLPKIVVPPLAISRADIVDRRGEILATSLESASLSVNPQRISDPEGLAAALARVLPSKSEGSLRAKLQSGKKFVYLAHDLTPRQRYAVNAIGEPALTLHRTEQRIYPHGRLAAHVLGHMGRDGAGLMGLERSLDDVLTNPLRAAEPLQTSLDIRVQYILTEELAMAMRTYRAKAAGGLVYDVNTGEVVAMASLPDFDPNTISGTPGEERRNRITQAVYELGSSFKTFTFAAALDDGIIDFSDHYDARKPLQVARFRIHDDHPLNDELTIPEVYAFSSNIGTAQLAMDLGRDRHRAFLTDLGFTTPVSLELGEGAAPITPGRWGDVSTMTISYGHGIAVTPLHLVRAIGAMVNGGRLIDATMQANLSPEPHYTRVVSERTSRQVRQLMRMAVSKGTGARAEAVGYRVGGKTGTAEKAGVGGYDEALLVSSFVGVFPMDDPRYVVFALMDEPQGREGQAYLRSGGWTAAPVVRNTVLRAAPLLGVEPRKEDKSLYQDVASRIRDRRK